MSTEPSSRSVSVLGDSWVISDSDPKHYQEQSGHRTKSLHIDSVSQEDIAASFSQEQPLTPLSTYSESELLADYEEDPVPATSPPDISESAASVASSGPELVMPSIMIESNATSNGSWVIPKKRPKQPPYESRKAPKMPKQRRDSTSPPGRQRSTAVNETAEDPRPVGGMKQWLGHAKVYLDQTLDQNNFIRILLNSFFLIMTLHLLLIPELLYQVPSLCEISGISEIYPKYCPSHKEQTSAVPGPWTKYQSVLRTQNQLHDYLNNTIQAISPLENFLKESDISLRQLYSSLRTKYSGARNEIDLEFQGIWMSSSSMSHDFISLKTDVEGFLNNFQAHKTFSDHQRPARDTASAQTNFLGRFISRDVPEPEQQEADGLALANHFTRLNQDLDATIARLARKTSVLLLHLAKVDDHIESMKAVIVREQQRLGRTRQDPVHMTVIWDSLRRLLLGSSDFSGAGPLSDDSKSLSELEHISSYHGLMADIIGKLDKELKALQKIRSFQI